MERALYILYLHCKISKISTGDEQALMRDEINLINLLPRQGG